jgi:allophanate hydrolase
LLLLMDFLSSWRGTPLVIERVREAYAAIATADRPEVWIALRPEAAALADAAAVEARLAAGERLPLAGRTLAVKDNIDVAGIPTTAGCPAFAYTPTAGAAAVARLLEAGAILLGKTNLDQFATGLVGTRSPFGAVRDRRRPEYVAGGSSSGSAVAVALGIADLALGTDTAGSGRVPAAFQGIVGIKPTRGLVPVTGVVPACRSLDCVSVFAADLAGAEAGLAVIEGLDAADPLGRPRPADAPLAAPPTPIVAVPAPEALHGLTAAAREAFAAAAARLEAAGAALVPLDPAPLVEAGALLYAGAFVAERHAAVGAFVESHRDAVDPTVGAVIVAAGAPSASDLFSDRERLDRLTLAVRRIFASADALLLPTTTAQPTIAAVAADPVGANTKLGTYTNCANLLDLCAVAVPAGEADGGCFGVSVLAPAFADSVAADVARLLLPAADPLSFVAQRATKDSGSGASGSGGGIELFVVGAHLNGQPLNHQLTKRGARFLGTAETAGSYRLFALDTEPAKPGLVRQRSGGASIAGERWLLSPAALGRFLAEIPAPMALGEVELSDGSRPVGFLCEPLALDGAEDITASGGWRAYLASRPS